MPSITGRVEPAPFIVLLVSVEATEREPNNMPLHPPSFELSSVVNVLPESVKGDAAL